MDWSNSLSGQAGALADIGNSFKKIYVDKMKLEKADLSLQKDYAKNYLVANGDVKKEKELEAKFDKDQSALRSQNMDSYIGAFGSLAGAVSQYAEESSIAAKVAEAAQKSLAVVSAVQAIIRAWGDPFPLNLVTVPATVAATGALLSSIGATSSSSGASSVPTISEAEQYDLNRDAIEADYTPITDRLDSQISLLESIALYCPLKYCKGRRVIVTAVLGAGLPSLSVT